LPFCKVTLRAKKPASNAYPKKLKTLGDHLRKKRLDLKLLQKELAHRLCIDPSTLGRWKKNETQPNRDF